VLQCVAVCYIVCRRLLSLSRTIASFRYVGAIRSPPPFWFSLPHANDDMPMMIWQCASPRHGSRIQETACQCKALSSSPILTLGRHVPHDNDSCRRVCVRVEHTLQHTATHCNTLKHTQTHECWALTSGSCECTHTHTQHPHS